MSTRVLNRRRRAMGACLRRGVLVAVALSTSACGVEPASPSPAAPARASAGWTRVWHDEFSGRAGARVSSARWRYDTGTHYPGGEPGWGNHELQTYTDSTENVSLDGHGNLAIRPLRGDDGRWTSGRIESRRADFRPPAHGSLAFSARIRLPAGGQGYWPAFWMLGAPFRGDLDAWPDAGELDAMENVNGEPEVSGSLHCGSGERGGPCREPDGVTATHALGRPAGDAGFHTYTVVWNTGPRRIRWYVDGRRYLAASAATIGAGTWRRTFGHGFFVLLNVAIGGDSPGAPDATTRSGMPMLVDRVTVARNPSASAGPPT